MSKEGKKASDATQPLVDSKDKPTTYDGQTSSEKDTPRNTYNVDDEKNDDDADASAIIGYSEKPAGLFDSFCNFFTTCCADGCDDSKKSASTNNRSLLSIGRQY